MFLALRELLVGRARFGLVGAVLVHPLITAAALMIDTHDRSPISSTSGVRG